MHVSSLNKNKSIDLSESDAMRSQLARDIRRAVPLKTQKSGLFSPDFKSTSSMYESLATDPYLIG